MFGIILITFVFLFLIIFVVLNFGPINIVVQNIAINIQFSLNTILANFIFTIF